MKITIIGRGNIGGGLDRLWTAAGHEVTALGRDGGDASGSDAVAVAIPSQAIPDALGKVSGVAGLPTIDACNAYGLTVVMRRFYPWRTRLRQSSAALPRSRSTLISPQRMTI